MSVGKQQRPSLRPGMWMTLGVSGIELSVVLPTQETCTVLGNMSPPSEEQKMDDYKKWKAKSKKFIAALDKIEKHLDEIEKLSRADYW